MFINEIHKERFTEMRVGMSENYRKKKEHLAFVFIMTGNEERFQKMKPYYDGVEGMFKAAKMFEEQDFSTGLRVLAKLAINLYNYNEKVEPIDLVMHLDPDGFELAIAAMRLRREGLSDDYQSKDSNSYIK